MPQPNRNKPGKRNLFDIKWMILSGSLAATLGFWGVFSKLENQGSTTAGLADQSQPPQSGSETNNTLAISLPPMPTLLPPSKDAAVNLSQQPAAPKTNRVARPAAGSPAPVKIFLGGSKPGAAADAPIVRTRSSQ